MRTSETIGDLANALAKAQGQMKNATLNKTNPHFKSKYADLAAIRDAVVPILSANGIAVVQGLDGLTVWTRLMHGTNQWIESSMTIPNGQMQELGSAITYARRYTLSAICGIAADEDDDGNAAQTIEPEDNGYLDWLCALEETAEKLGMDGLMANVKSEDTPEPWRARLRTETATWNKLKTIAQRGR